METKDKKTEMIACEGFIRRAAAINMPFMLKGSYITRQYFKNPEDRIPNDLDWVYLQRITSVNESKEIFDGWATVVTEYDAAHAIDGVLFCSFSENAFWRQIDYAMDDDFPTVNTDLAYLIDESEALEEFSMDVSFNLPIKEKPIQLNYTPLRGTPFILPFTVPLALQVAWKLHQTIVRPRFKDVFDLIHLLKHPHYAGMAQRTVDALMDECIVGKVAKSNITSLFSHALHKLFPNGAYQRNWHYWRHDQSCGYNPKDGILSYYDYASLITDASKLPEDIQAFETLFYNTMDAAGLTMDLIKNHPYVR